MMPAEEYENVQARIASLLLDLSRLKSPNRQPVDRHIAICATQLEDMYGRFCTYVIPEVRSGRKDQEGRG